MVIQYSYVVVQEPMKMWLVNNSSISSFVFVISSLSSLDFCMSTDERIKSYLICQDWKDELQDANENRWTVDQNKFDKRCIAREYEISIKNFIFSDIAFLCISEGPFIRLTSTNRDDSFKDLVGIIFELFLSYLLTKRFGIGLIHRKLKLIVVINKRKNNICL